MPGDFPTTSVRKDGRSGSEHPGELQMPSAFSLVRAPLMFVQNWLSPLFERPQAYTKSPAQSSQWPFHTASRTNNGGPRHRLLELQTTPRALGNAGRWSTRARLGLIAAAGLRLRRRDRSACSGRQWSCPWSAEKSDSQSRKSSSVTAGQRRARRREASASRERQRTAPYPSEISGLGLEQPKEEAKTPAYDESLAEATELDRKLEERRLEGIFTLPKDASQCNQRGAGPVINFYMLLINKRSGSNPKLPKVHAFSSFFFNMLDGSGYARVRRWTRRINLFEKDMVVVPVNIDNRHWVCMVIDFRSKCITYYDSMLSGDYRRRDVLLNYLRQESEDKLKKPI
ncbi:cysteine proteinase [Linderina pennispora]|uniref:Cysteine proteinase n=1 Tax=Linderina pennispora TaxID=61395 RepID=A0A1Y1VZL8_9FUNG|nr:cysteine proteinase [Linderina pennispora]ORX66717.1 cysteine proteinase [Linderina pennispora]